MTDPVVFTDVETDNGMMIGHAELNVESTLNSLSLDMVRLLQPALDAWEERDDIVCILITAAGERAFCAGGDIQALYAAIDANHAANAVVNDYPFRFFEEEYRLDFTIHECAKPVITIGHGIVMGGGLGIFGASQYRVLTEKSRLAVPEITIGLFPDAGASWTLRNMPQYWASFLGLTGSHINAADAMLCGVGTHLVAHDARLELLAQAKQLPWSGDGSDLELIDEWMAGVDMPTLPDAQLSSVPERPSHFDDFSAEVAAIESLAGQSDWIDRGLANLEHGCPTTAGIVVEQLRRVPEMSLADSYRMELTVATHCANNDDFHEGVRALLIDKDNSPKWRFGNLTGLEWEHVISHFVDPWPTHPLTDLGKA
ncbi:MAG: enoyl-CoA hydratase/isomerase family protein [Pseudomonadales bacterium]|nr:enoyl-CoA hydratase/isomerase family protein [Pseudomonadales bacterium]